MMYDCKKLVQVLNFFAQKNGGKISYEKATSLLYLVDRYHIRVLGFFVSGGIWYFDHVTLINSALSKLQKGNGTCQDALNYYNTYIKIDNNTIYSKEEIDDSIFSPFDKEVIDLITKTFMDFPLSQLEDFILKLPEIEEALTLSSITHPKVIVAIYLILAHSELDYLILNKFGLKSDPFYQPEEVLQYVRRLTRS